MENELDAKEALAKQLKVSLDFKIEEVTSVTVNWLLVCIDYLLVEKSINTV